jgi:DNA-binding GntR family transcriptional regulator
MSAQTPAPFGSARTSVTKRDRIVAEIRRLIIEGELPRGQRLQQDELAVRFQTSITPVREALRQLAAEGLLMAQPNRGVRVADADLEQVKFTYVQRRLIEPYAMRRAARRISPRDLDQADALVEAMEAAVAAGDRIELNRRNYDFHFLFYSRTGIPALETHIATLWNQFPWDVLQVLPTRMLETNAEHRAQLEAVRAADIDAVGSTTEVHLAHSFARLAEHVTGAEVPDPFDIDHD